MLKRLIKEYSETCCSEFIDLSGRSSLPWCASDIVPSLQKAKQMSSPHSQHSSWNAGKWMFSCQDDGSKVNSGLQVFSDAYQLAEMDILYNVHNWTTAQLSYCNIVIWSSICFSSPFSFFELKVLQEVSFDLSTWHFCHISYVYVLFCSRNSVHARVIGFYCCTAQRSRTRTKDRESPPAPKWTDAAVDAD